MRTNWELLEEEWQREYDKLETEKDMHRLSFLLTKMCKCKMACCRHYETEKNRVFGDRINRLLAKGVMISAASDMRVMDSVERL